MDREVLLRDLTKLRERAAQTLSVGQSDFHAQMQFIKEKRAGGERWAPSGVLVPLEFDREKGEHVFVLNKRSGRVQQPGDLCCPGGRSDRRHDRLLAGLLLVQLLAFRRSAVSQNLARVERSERDLLLYIYAGCLRESWEEMRLQPWNVEFYGVLPTHAMPNFLRVIFPVVGRIRRPWKPRPNWEVERIIRLPLSAFFQVENYALCRMILPLGVRDKLEVDSWEVPCLSIMDNSQEEILWGATFRILLTFMARVFDLDIAQINPARRISKELPEQYYARLGRASPQRPRTR